MLLGCYKIGRTSPICGGNALGARESTYGAMVILPKEQRKALMVPWSYFQMGQGKYSWLHCQEVRIFRIPTDLRTVFIVMLHKKSRRVSVMCFPRNQGKLCVPDLEARKDIVVDVQWIQGEYLRSCFTRSQGKY
jgi:hypothetical protein